MSFLTINNDLCPFLARFHKAAVYLLLQLEDNRAGRIHDGDMITPRRLVGRRRLAVGTQEDFLIMQTGKLFVVYRSEAHRFEAFHLEAIVHDVAEAVECISRTQFSLRAADGCYDSETKARAAVYFYFYSHRHCTSCKRWRTTSRSHAFCSDIVISELSSTTASSAFRRGLSSRVESR